MGYELHIECNDPIQLEDWKAAVVQVDGVALRTADSAAINPATREEIRIPVEGGDAVVDFSGSPVDLRWSASGRVSFGPPADWDEPRCALRDPIFSLAKQLGARIVGDEGEEYRAPEPPNDLNPWWKLW